MDISDIFSRHTSSVQLTGDLLIKNVKQVLKGTGYVLFLSIAIVQPLSSHDSRDNVICAVAIGSS